MMKYSITSLCIFMTLISFSCAGELQCSANGTDIYYINGILAKDYQNADLDRKNIQEVFNQNPKLLDTKGKVSFKLIYNPSYGAWYDMAELYASDYFYRTGRSDGFSLFMVRARARLDEYNSPSLFNALSFLIPPYYKILKNKAEHLKQKKIMEQYKASPLTYQQLQNAKSNVVDSTLAQLYSAIRDNKKVIFIPHSQGNAIVKEAYKRTISISEGHKDFVRNYTGVLHVASPVENISPSFTNVSSYLLTNDWMVNLANELLPELNANGGTHTLIQSSVLPNSPGYDEFNHEFSQVYINPNNKASDGMIAKDMRTIFKEKVIDLAAQLKDNCIHPDIKVTTPDANLENGIMQISGFAGPARKITVKVKDVAINEDSKISLDYNYDHSKTFFSWKLERSYFGTKTLVADGSSTGDFDVVIDIPYRDLYYVLTVNSENAYGYKADKVTTFQIKANLPPVLTISSQKCILDSNGYSGGRDHGKMEFAVSVSDDQFSYDKKTFYYYSEDATSEVAISDGVATAKITAENSCPVVKRVYHYDIWSVCDAMWMMVYCRDIAGANCSPEQAEDNSTLVNSGGQFNEVYYMDEKNNIIYRSAIPSNNQPGQSLTATIFDYNTMTNIDISIPNKCSQYQVYPFERSNTWFFNYTVN